MDKLMDVMPWIVALPPAAWESRRIWLKYGWLLAVSMGVVIYGFILLWLIVIIHTAYNIDTSEVGRFSAAQVALLLVGPLLVTAYISRKTSFSAGVAVGFATGFCILCVTMPIGIGITGL